MTDTCARIPVRSGAHLAWVVVLASVACAPETAQTDHSPSEGEQVAALVGPFMSASQAAAEGVGRSDADWVIVHVDRTRDEYSAGHLPGARFLPFSALAVERDGLPNEFPTDDEMVRAFESLGVSESSRVLLTGWPLGVARAWIALEMLGLGDQSFVLDGGQAAWAAVGGAVTPEEQAFEGGRLASTPNRSTVVDAHWVNQGRVADGIAILDARPAEQFSGEEPGGGVTRGGHIPGAAHLHWESLRGPAGELLQSEELARRFAVAGVQAGDTVVAYCRTGVQAGYLYLVARHLGFEARLYDGSYIEWSSREALPVERGS